MTIKANTWVYKLPPGKKGNWTERRILYWNDAVTEDEARAAIRKETGLKKLPKNTEVYPQQISSY